MGFNTTVVFLNDGLHHIEDDEDFGKKLVDAIRNFRKGDRFNNVIFADKGGNVAEVIAVEHADHSIMVLVGGNSGTVVDPYACGFNHHEEKAQIVALQSLADKLGFKLTKKKTK